VDYHRHDWMNDVQVLHGYIQLNKQEKLKVYTNNIIDRIRRESLISKLGVPFLIAYIISFRANSKVLTLEVRLQEDVNLAKFGDQGTSVARLIIIIVEAYKAAAAYGDGDANLLSITMNVWGDQLSIGFEYDGASDIDKLNDK